VDDIVVRKNFSKAGNMVMLFFVLGRYVGTRSSMAVVMSVGISAVLVSSSAVITASVSIR